MSKWDVAGAMGKIGSLFGEIEGVNEQIEGWCRKFENFSAKIEGENPSAFDRLVSRVMLTNCKLAVVNQVYFDQLQRMIDTANTLGSMLEDNGGSLFSISLPSTPITPVIPTTLPNEKTASGDSNDKLLNKKRRLVTKCPHSSEKHYAKDMCNKCYHSKGRDKKAFNCEHLLKPLYAKGLCQKCYHSNYSKVKQEG